MTRILFICHGNICRSPMAEFVMKKIVRDAGLERDFHIESAATSREELGNPVYPPARRELEKHGLSCAGKTARQLTAEDCGRFDLLVCMDGANVRNVRRVAGPGGEGKIRLLLEYTGHPRDVADPWYTGDFTAAWRDIAAGCEGLFRALTKQSARTDPGSVRADGSSSPA